MENNYLEVYHLLHRLGVTTNYCGFWYTAYAVQLFNESSDVRIMKRRVTDSYPDIDYIRHVYEDLSYYFQIGIDSGAGAILEFDLFDFASRFSHSPVVADSALKLLALGGYIDYTEEQDVPARVMLIASRDEISAMTSSNATARAFDPPSAVEIPAPLPRQPHTEKRGPPICSADPAKSTFQVSERLSAWRTAERDGPS